VTGAVTCAATGGVTVLLGKPDPVGRGRVGAAAAKSSTTIRLDGGVGAIGGVGSDVTIRVGIGSIVSFFDEAEPEVADGEGIVVVTDDVTGAATGDVTLLLGKPDSAGDVRLGAAAAKSSTTIRLDGGVDGVDPEVVVCVAIGSTVSFFAETELTTDDGGAVTCAAIGATLVLW
jgi:hypothetical protein